MRRAAFVLALVIGLMGVMVLPIQAHDGSEDSRVDTRNESNSDDRNSSREASVRSRSDDNTSLSNTSDDRNRGHSSRRLIRLSGANEVPAGDPDGIGWARVSVRPDEGTVCYAVKVKRLDAITAAHIHVGAAGTNGGVVVDLAILNADTKVSGNSTLYSDCIEGLDATLLTSIKENRAGYYVNVHTTVYPAGAIRGQLGKVVSS
ncbi:MAG TPA: CHRD domain-containing protein [Acidimicrobiia bacterium]|nr:CHRD domain-containing protein [Acidimicrobiia bacterium]